MDLLPFFKSIVEQDTAAVVICDLNHTIIYMNPTAIERYSKRGGVALIGQSLLNCHNANSGTIINKVIDWFKGDRNHNIIHTYYNEKENKDVYMVALRNDKSELIGYYEKHEYRTKDDSPMYKF
jgi:PAS domain-containing protein